VRLWRDGTGVCVEETEGGGGQRVARVWRRLLAEGCSRACVCGARVCLWRDRGLLACVCVCWRRDRGLPACVCVGGETEVVYGGETKVARARVCVCVCVEERQRVARVSVCGGETEGCSRACVCGARMCLWRDRGVLACLWCGGATEGCSRV
jgi:hypothetical protein